MRFVLPCYTVVLCIMFTPVGKNGFANYCEGKLKIKSNQWLLIVGERDKFDSLVGLSSGDDNICNLTTQSGNPMDLVFSQHQDAGSGLEDT